MNKHRDELSRVIGAGWALLDPWPDAFHAALAETLAAHATGGAVFSGMEAAFGDLYNLLHRREGWRATLCNELRLYALGRSDIAVKRGKRVAAAAQAAGADKNLDLAAVGEALGVSLQRCRQDRRSTGCTALHGPAFGQVPGRRRGGAAAGACAVCSGRAHLRHRSRGDAGRQSAHGARVCAGRLRGRGAGGGQGAPVPARSSGRM